VCDRNRIGTGHGFLTFRTPALAQAALRAHFQRKAEHVTRSLLTFSHDPLSWTARSAPHPWDINFQNLAVTPVSGWMRWFVGTSGLLFLMVFVSIPALVCVHTHSSN
jgi:hypothetical protein